MRLLKICGKPWELTLFQDIYEPREGKDFATSDAIPLVVNNQKNFWKNGTMRIYSDNKVRTKAKVWIEIRPMVNQSYWLFYDKKGFYVNIKNKKTYISNLDCSNVEYSEIID